jgi:large subunit ribosomal protein L15e
MGMYKYLSKLWQDGKAQTEEIIRKRLIELRRQPSVIVLDRPSRLDKAHRLGYKAKQGFIMGRIKIETGGRHRRSIPKGRKPKTYGMYYTPTRNIQAIAEQRISKRFPNLEVLNSYYYAGDGKHKWYEVIMVDPHHPAIINDKQVNFIVDQRGRSERGLTSAGKRSKGARRVEAKAIPKRASELKTRIMKRRI